MATGINITGTSSEDTLQGGVGDDTLLGGAGADVLLGAGGNDVLNGGSGADTMTGGAGDDLYYADNAGDTLVEAAAGGTDKVHAGRSWTLADNLEQLVLTGTAYQGIGNALANTLAGNGGTNWLDGKAGADTMTGGDGADTYIVDNAGDRAVESGGVLGGHDRVFASVSFALGAYVEDLTLDGTANINATGNALANVLQGNAGNNRLDGRVGADTMRGGAGDDIYHVDSAGDVVVEGSGAGTDKVVSAISYTLAGGHVENLALTGIANTSATGNALTNVLEGNAGDNVLDGLTGADTMKGGAGDDTYHVQVNGDTVVEAAGNGVDLVYASLSWTLSDNVEQLVLTGTGYQGIGNALANTITGNSGTNALDGKAGADTMRGGDGNDTYRVDSSADVVVESAAAAGGVDRVTSTVGWTLGAYFEQLTLEGTAISATGNALDNLLQGTSGANVLDGKAGADTLRGYDGNDIYYVDNTGDSIAESSLAAGGVDKVVSTISWNLNANVENLTLAGTTDRIYGVGNGLDNRMIGNTAMNGLAGGAGNDTLDGAAGRDGLLGGTGDDVFRFSALSHSTAAAFDGIGDFVRGSDRIDVSALDAVGGVAGVQDFSFIGSAAFSANASGQLRYERVPQQSIEAAQLLLNQAGLDVDLTTTSAVMLFGSTDADAAAEFAVIVVGTTVLSAADLLL